jgi:hypothetical protein
MHGVIKAIQKCSTFKIVVAAIKMFKSTALLQP